MRPVLIAGPTASGKSALAMAIAQETGGVIINVDSMQVYRDLRVLTARPTPDEEAATPHRLYGHVDGAERYSVGRFLADARAAIEEAGREGRRPVLVGGTGLYFDALLNGLAAVPEISSELREQVRARVASLGTEAHSELARVDPAAAAKITRNDAIRISRALEVFEATGRTLSAWQEQAALPPVVSAADAVKIVLDPPRAELRARIARRFAAMLEQGALDEVRALAARNLPDDLPIMKAHGVPHLVRHLRGDASREEATELSVRDVSRYSKRQRTWFRHHMADWTWLAPEAAIAGWRGLIS